MRESKILGITLNYRLRGNDWRKHTFEGRLREENEREFVKSFVDPSSGVVYLESG